MIRTDGTLLRLVLATSLATLGLSSGSPARASYPLRSHPVLGEYALPAALDIELVAQEPLVFDPVDLEFDEFGSAWVLEMVGFPVVPDDQPGPGRVVRLRDTTGDGSFDQRQVFADGFRYADSLLPYRGGILVADPPDLIYLADRDGDGRAEIRQTLLKGFEVGPSESNFNGLTFGPDGWVHGANGSSGGTIYFPERPDDKTSIRGLDLRFRFELDSTTGTLQRGRLETTTAMGGGFGVTFDDWGRRYVTHEQRHIQAVMIEGRYLPGNQTWPRTVIEISDHGQGDTARIFPISAPVDRPNHPEQAGYFTSGCGLTHYGGSRLGTEFNGSFFVGEAVHNLVHRDVVGAGSTSTPLARRAANEQRSEFLAARDPWFRPVNFTTGPDGLLYLVDMQRAVVEHPEWIPAELRDGFDLRAGADRGRIYRIRSRAESEAAPDDPGALAQASLEERVVALGSSNQWRRFTAQRLLQAQAAEQPEQPRLTSRIAQVLRQGIDAAAPVARAHRLWLLHDLGEAGAEDLLPVLADEHPRLREIALDLLSEVELSAQTSSTLNDRIRPLLRDSDRGVRLAALLTLSRRFELTENTTISPELAEELARIGSASDHDEVLQTAILLVARHEPIALLAPLSQRLQAGAVPLELAANLIRLIARPPGESGPRLGTLTSTLQTISVLDSEARIVLFEALAESLPKARPEEARDAASASQLTGLLSTHFEPERADEEVLATWKILDKIGLADGSAEVTEQLVQRAATARTVAMSRDQPVALRLRALRLFEVLPEGQQIASLLELLAPGTPSPLAIQALDRLSTFSDASISQEIVTRWRTFPPDVRSRAGDVLLYRRSNHETLLDALESGKILVGEMDFHLERRRTLLRWSTDEIGARAQKLFSDGGVDTRREAFDAARPALALTGDAKSGQTIFEELCTRCHQIGGLGTLVGPDLSDVFRKSSSALLHDIVDPNARAGSEYLAYDVETVDGQLHSGLLSSENENQVVLRQADGETRTISRQNVRTLESTGLSLMPEELEVGLSHQQIADLLAFLQKPR